MYLITPNLTIVIIVIIVVVAILLALWMKTYAYYDKGSFHTFIAILSGFGIFVTFVFYYNLVQLQEQQQELFVIQEISRINDSVLNSVLDAIKEASNIIPNFVLSITPLTNAVCDSTAPEDPINAQTCTVKMTLSYRIFTLWQDVILSSSFIIEEPVPYISNFLQRANSKQLYDEWSVNKLNFDTNTQKLGDLLFEYALPITVQTPQEYISAANNLIADPRFKSIFS